MKPRDLLDLTSNRVSVEEFTAGLLSKDKGLSAQAGKDMLQAASELGISLTDFIKLSIDPHKGDLAAGYNANDKLDGWDLAKVALNLPVSNDYTHGTVIQAAGETFQTFPGVKALFPAVIDDTIRFRYRQDQLESVAPLLASTRTISGNEMQSSIVEDGTDGTTYNFASAIAEGARIPIRSIRASEYAVKIWKFGLGYKLTYEFSRRASLDLVTPYAARVKRAIELGKVKAATGTLINGDNANPAAPVVNQSSFVTGTGQTTAAGKLNWEAFLGWLVSRAKAGAPIDTIVGNWDTYLGWLTMFAKPTQFGGPTAGALLNAAGVAASGSPIPDLNLAVKFAVSSSAPAGQLLGFSQPDTLEQLIEANSQIEESSKAIDNQTITYVLTENSGFRLVFADTRSVLNLDAIA